MKIIYLSILLSSVLAVPKLELILNGKNCVFDVSGLYEDWTIAGGQVYTFDGDEFGTV